MQRIIFLLIMGFSLLSGKALLAQISADTLSVLLAARAYENRIVLRWVPGNFKSWQWGNQSAYRIERFTISNPDGNLSSNEIQQTKILLESSLSPLPEAEWKPLADTNQMAIVAAGSLYSDTFETSDMGDESAVMYSENSSAENRYGFGLFAADQFLDIAQAMGLAYVDRTVEPGYTYRYEVSFAANPADMLVLAGLKQISADTRVHLIPPVDLQAEWRNRKVMLGWNRQLVDSLYTSYFVEKSLDGGLSFVRANHLPLVYFPPEGASAPYMYFLDTLLDNETEYLYRVRGKTPFGELGPPSLSISGKGLPPPLAFLPRITRMDELPEAAGLQISWSVEDTLTEQISGFHVYRSVEKDVAPIRLNKNLLDKDLRQYTDPNPIHGHYYRISAIDINGYEIFSLNKLALLTDHNPPTPPQGLQATMDSTGQAILSWKNNIEEDLQGYRVYTSNIKDGTYFELTYLPVQSTRFKHKFSMNTLHKAEYFKVRAIDLRGNYSDFSAPAKVIRPDTRPPTRPVIKNIRADTKAVYLEWANSSS